MESSVCRDPMSYRGKKNTTVSGTECQKWNVNTPHKNDFANKTLYPDYDMDHNFCRNPSKDVLGPWCYPMNSSAREKEQCFYSNRKLRDKND